MKDKKLNETKIGNKKVKTGNAGEVHQQAQNGNVMTTQQGTPISDDQNSLRIGERGPTAMEDFSFREKLFHFDHERIPERVVHARGYGIHGYFENYEPLSDITCADLFQRPGEKTDLFARFSTVVGNKGSADLVRDVRGFAVKMYTKEGNWDLVGNNMPVFFIQDAMKFPDLVHSIKQEPDKDFPQATAAHDNFWDFISLSPEAINMIMWVVSDRAIPRSFRFMEGFGVHTFRMINKDGKSTYVKFHWKPKQGLQSVLWNEALKINGADPDFHRKDMWNAIEDGDYPEWELGIQAFDDDFADKFDFDILDPTKLIPEELIPVRPIGKMVLNRNVDNFFAETEQVAFCTQNIVRGIDFTNDPLIQGRNFSYLDTQLKRLGSPNFTHIPINSPKSEVRNYQQDGHMAMHNPKGRVNYEPNSWDEDNGPRESAEKGFSSFPAKENGEKGRIRSHTFADHYSQARQFYKSQTEIEQEHMANALMFELSKVEKVDIRERMISHLLNVDKNLAEKTAKGLGIKNMPEPAEAAMKPKDLPSSKAFSIINNGPKNFKGRKVGVLISDGFDGESYKTLEEAVKKEGAQLGTVSLTSGMLKLSNGEEVNVNEKVDGAPSVVFDAVALLINEDSLEDFKASQAARDFITDAVSHKKFIAYSKAGEKLITELSHMDQVDEGMFELKGSEGANDFIKACAKLRFWKR